MSWDKLDDGLHDHPKIEALLELEDPRLGISAIGLFTLTLTYSSRHLTDGFIRAGVAKRLSQHDENSSSR